MRMILVLSTFFAVAVNPLATYAQSSAPTPHECRVAANKLASNPRSEAFRWALARGRLAECGEIGAEALAGAIRAGASVRDIRLLQQLTLTASLNQSPAILRAALDVAQMNTAEIPSRVASLNIVLRQHDPALALEGGLQRLASEPMGRLCRVDFIPHARYFSSTPLPSDYRGEVKAAMSRVATRAGELAVIRDLALCVGEAIDGFGEWSDTDPHGTR